VFVSVCDAVTERDYTAPDGAGQTRVSIWHTLGWL